MGQGETPARPGPESQPLSLRITDVIRVSDEAEDMVAFRLAPLDRAAIQRLIDQGAFRNRSDFLRHAVKLALKESGVPAGRPAAPDLDFEGIHLPEPAPNRAHRAPRRGAGRR